MKLTALLNRPILASVIALIIMLCGLVALFNIPVNQFPDISPPSIHISADYPGANAQTAAKVVATQIEKQMAGIPNLLYMSTTTSSSGTIGITLTYEVGTDLNYAINDVLNRIYAALPLLPSVVQRLGVIARKSSPDMLMIVSFYSNPYIDPKFVSNYLKRIVENDLLLLPDVGDVQIFGNGAYALRIWLDLLKMQYYGITTSDIQQAILDQNVENYGGRINSPPNEKNDYLDIMLTGGSMYSTPQQFGNIIIRNNKNQIIRIKDIAKVELGAVSYTTIGELNFRNQQNKIVHYPCNVMAIYLTPGANQLIAKQQIMQKLVAASKNFPYGLHYQVTLDNSRFVEASIKNVSETLIVAFILVGIVIFIFLRNWRSSLIAICSIPVSILGTIACLYIAGLSLNTLSLFALILSVGIVVDDSIVIIENIERIRHEHPEITLIEVISLTLQEVFGAVVAIVLVLSVVFIPAMTLSGLTGSLFRQFAITMACAIILSGICALTFTPAINLLFNRNAPYIVKNPNIFEKWGQQVTNFYIRMSKWLIIHQKTSLIIWLVICSLTIAMFEFLPRGFIPNEDQGLIFGSINLPSSSGLEQTNERLHKIIAQLMKNSAIDSVVSVAGFDFLDAGTQKTYSGTIFIALKNWAQRTTADTSSDAIIAKINNMALLDKGLRVRAFGQPVIRGLGLTGGVEVYIEDRLHGDPHQLQIEVDKLIKALKKHKEIVFALQTLDTNTLETSIVPNQAMVKTYGLNLQDVYSTMQTAYSNNNINFAYIMQGLTWVILQADYPYRSIIDKIRNLYVRSANNNLVPLSQVVTIKNINDAQVIQKFNGYIASRLTVFVIPIYSQGQIMNIVEQELSHLDKGYSYEWVGTSYQLTQSQKTSALAFIFSVIMIYLVLAALYELWRLPLVVMMGIPFSLFGAGIILLIAFKINDLYFQISLLALLGLSTKNIILLIEFALQKLKQGATPIDSILFALQTRFRPIVMTSITFIFGTLPLAFAHGANSNAQHSVGIGIIGGIIGSVVLGTLLVPAYFVMIMRNYKAPRNKDNHSTPPL
jgi:hydrophobe/amphiphile efflux-1 (HAE1) family protein